MSIEPEQALALAQSLEPLKYFPRSAQGLAEVAIVIAETCPTPEQAETATREILRSHDEWPGMRSFAAMLRRSLPRPAPAPPPPDAPAAETDPLVIAYQARRQRAKAIWDALPRADKLTAYRSTYEQLAADAKWTSYHSEEETKAQAVYVCIDRIAWDLPDDDTGDQPAAVDQMSQAPPPRPRPPRPKPAPVCRPGIGKKSAQR